MMQHYQKRSKMHDFILSLISFSVEASGCHPDACGPNTECLEGYGGKPQCQCLPGFRPRPIPGTGCEPDLIQLCVPGPCGLNADCLVTTLGEQCQCRPGFVGNPFTGCFPIGIEKDPCNPSPCGRNTRCTVNIGQAFCECLPGMLGDPLSPAGCKPECVRQDDCPTNLACINAQCQDPCPGACGISSQCTVDNHNPICSCPPGYVGNPFDRCVLDKKPTPKPDPCNPSPCGTNTLCTVLDGGAVCECMSDNYIGNPLVGCKPECILNTECPSTQACINQKCRDPCPGTCGLNADCRVAIHRAVCTCVKGFEGDPFRQCYPKKPNPIPGSCVPNPCGPYSICTILGPRPVCECQPGYFGKPPNCQPECLKNSDCTQDKACINQKCQDPCPGVCGANALCQVVNHNPICSCPQGFTGDPFNYCHKGRTDFFNVFLTSTLSYPYA